MMGHQVLRRWACRVFFGQLLLGGGSRYNSVKLWYHSVFTHTREAHHTMRAPRVSRRGVRDDFDGAWKNMLSERRFASFVKFFMPDKFDQINWSRGVVFLEQELRAITRKS